MILGIDKECIWLLKMYQNKVRADNYFIASPYGNEVVVRSQLLRLIKWSTLVHESNSTV